MIELGGPANLLPLVQREKYYDLNTIPKLVGDDECFVIGAGAGPWPYVGVNCEVIFVSDSYETQYSKTERRR